MRRLALALDAEGDGSPGAEARVVAGSHTEHRAQSPDRRREAPRPPCRRRAQAERMWIRKRANRFEAGLIRSWWSASAIEVEDVLRHLEGRPATASNAATRCPCPGSRRRSIRPACAALRVVTNGAIVDVLDDVGTDDAVEGPDTGSASSPPVTTSSLRWRACAAACRRASVPRGCGRHRAPHRAGARSHRRRAGHHRRDQTEPVVDDPSERRSQGRRLVGVVVVAEVPPSK
jgi:hypothetical protein